MKTNHCHFEGVEGFYKIIHLKRFRETQGVLFEVFDSNFLQDVKGIDKVVHCGNAISPGPVGDCERPWYMHPYQADNLIVFSGKRYIELYSLKHKTVETFVVTPTQIFHNGTLVCDDGGILTWSPNVFHRVESRDEGSVSMNFAQRYEGFDIKDNFNIYELDIQTGNYFVIREGHEDQF